MLFPNIHPWMEQANYLPRHFIESGDVRSFMSVAMSTGEREVAFDRLPAMLFGQNMIDLERKGKSRLREQAILASIERSLSKNPGELLVHCS